MSAVTGSSSNYRSLAPTKAVFDISNEADVLQLLRTIHQSALAVEDKNELRDYIFTYRLNKTIVNIAALQERFSEFDLAVVDGAVSSTETNTVSDKAASTTPSNRIGHHRKSPSFQAPKPRPTPEQTAAPKRAPAEAAAVQTAPIEEVTAASSTEAQPATEATPKPAATPTAAEVSKTAPAPEVDAAVNKVAIKKVPDTTASTQETNAPTEAAAPAASASREVPETTSAVDTSTTTQASMAEPVPETTTPATAEPVSASALSPAERIKEIKHEINLKVGNPIALIDIDNAIGREYMAALLDAMKQTSVEDSSAASERAMSRLENAFQAVEELLAKEDAGKQEVPKAPETAPATAAPQPSEPDPSNAAKVRAAEVSENPAKATAPAEMPLASAHTATATEEGEVETSAPITSVADEQAPSPEPVQAAANEAAVVEATQATSSAPIPKTAPAPKAHSISSPANDKRVGTVLAEQEAARKAEKPQDVGDPLMQEKVTRGLEQLLSEWSIFKRSGMFGTGPNGIEHPLYETLDQLTMSTVLTGRFEGVTPEVKRSINDYMNGWRYEEGIVHESGETFEHYLRRVVHHILEKRTKSVDAPA